MPVKARKHHYRANLPTSPSPSPSPPPPPRRIRRLYKRPARPRINWTTMRLRVWEWMFRIGLGWAMGYVVFLLLCALDTMHAESREWRKWVCPERLTRVVCVKPGTEDPPRFGGVGWEDGVWGGERGGDVYGDYGAWLGEYR